MVGLEATGKQFEECSVGCDNSVRNGCKRIARSFMTKEGCTLSLHIIFVYIRSHSLLSQYVSFYASVTPHNRVAIPWPFAQRDESSNLGRVKNETTNALSAGNGRELLTEIVMHHSMKIEC